MERVEFGTTADGTPVEKVSITSDALRLEVITLGAVIRDLRPRGGPMRDRPLVLGLGSVADYEQHSPYFGAIAGRNANRIGNGQFTLDGKAYQVTRNTPAGHHLHGGHDGFGKRVWRIADASDEAVTLEITGPDGEDGYPGTLQASVTYRLEGRTLACELNAETDAPTLCNLALHSYFNFDGSPSIRDHIVMIAAGQFTPCDADLIPTGAIEPVAGTPYDFRQARRIDDFDTLYDANYCLGTEPLHSPVHAARVESDRTGVAMDLYTTEPGVQFYDGAKIRVPVPGLEGAAYGAHAGLCLEPQRWPDAPNHADFPSSVLRPGETYRQVTEYRFDWPED